MMTRLKRLAASFAAATMVLAPSVNAETPDADPQPVTKGEAKLAKMLEGRVAGEPQNCIRNFPTARLTVIDGTALVYKSGKTLYVNIPENARSLDDRDIQVRRTSFGSRLCNTDIISTADQGTGMYTGAILLGKFVPYTKEKAS